MGDDLACACGGEAEGSADVDEFGGVSFDEAGGSAVVPGLGHDGEESSGVCVGKLIGGHVGEGVRELVGLVVG